MKKIISILVLFIFFSCSTGNMVSNRFDDTYGYSEKNPINVGELSPRNSNMYLSSLTGPNGEEVHFDRVGSCCPFKTKNALIGNHGLLDKYWVTYKGKKDTVYIFINIYDKSDLGIPIGFKRK